MICGIINIIHNTNTEKPKYICLGFFLLEIMKNIDYIIVGDGYAALFFAHQLIRDKKNFLLFSEEKKGASQISAGIINPVVLKRFTSFWKAEEQIDILKKTLSEIEKYTHKNYLVLEPIHRIFHDETEKALWLKKSDREDLRKFLKKDFVKFSGIKNPFETGQVHQSARLDVQAFFTDLFQYLENSNFLIKEKFNYVKLNAKENIYEDFHFKNIVFCEGMGVKQNPYFSEVPVHHNKGHHITVKLSEEIQNKATIKKKHFLFPLDQENYYYGGTYDRENIDEAIEEDAIEILKKSLSEFYPFDYEIINVEYGFRPTVNDRRPILGHHPEFKSFYLFNGLGARGILNGCYFANELFEHIEKGKPLHEEVDLKRFQ